MTSAPRSCSTAVTGADVGPRYLKKTLQRNVKMAGALALESRNVVLVAHAINDEIDDGNKVRIHEPTDSRRRRPRRDDAMIAE